MLTYTAVFTVARFCWEVIWVQINQAYKAGLGDSPHDPWLFHGAFRKFGQAAVDVAQIPLV